MLEQIQFHRMKTTKDRFISVSFAVYKIWSYVDLL